MDSKVYMPVGIFVFLMRQENFVEKWLEIELRRQVLLKEVERLLRQEERR
jgi:hypothetical protein